MELEDWLIKLYEGVSRENRFNKKLFLTLIADKWIVIANGTGQYNKLFYNQVAKLNRGLYMRTLIKRIISKMRS